VKKLETIANFGAIDAESDGILMQCFEDHPALSQAMNGTRSIIIGRKGSGKSAIFKKLLASETCNTIVLGQTFQDYPWAYHNRQGSDGVIEEQRFVQSWKYLILLIICKMLLRYDGACRSDAEAAEHLSLLRRFVADSFGRDDVDVTHIFLPQNHINLRTLLQAGVGLVQMQLGLATTPIDQLPTFYSAINEALMEHVMGVLSPENQYIVCFDQLDIGFEPSNTTYMAQMVGLLRAASDINVEAHLRGVRLNVVVFLRDDIFDALHFNDKNKMLTNSVQRMEWDSDSLKRLIEKRLTQVCSEDGSPVRWDDVFDESTKMTGHQRKYDHMIDRTFLRPRDIIEYSNLVLESYGVRTVDAGMTRPSKFTNQDITDAEPAFSEHLLREIDEELRPHIPDCYERVVETLQGVGRDSFSFEEFEHQWTTRLSPNGTHRQSSDVLKLLYKYSVIGYLRVGGAQPGSGYVLHYRMPNLAYDQTATTFQVHKGLIKALGLTRSYGSRH